MAHRTRKTLEPIGDPNDPRGMAVMLSGFLEWMRVKNYSAKTIECRQFVLHRFIHWAEERGIVRPNEVAKPILERYQRFLYHFRKKNGDPISFRTQHGNLVPIRAWFKWLARNNHVLYNPASELELPKLGHRLPKHVLTVPEAEQIIMIPDVNKNLGIRDRAILERSHGGVQPAALRRGLRPWHHHGAAGQGTEGPHGAHRGASHCLD